MIKLFFISLFFSSSAFANLPVDFTTKSGTSVKGSEITQNINYLKSLLQPYGYSINFPQIEADSLISANKMNQVFNALKISGVTYSNKVLEDGKIINPQDIANNFSLLFTAAKSLVPNSCKRLLALRPELLNQNSTYYIDIDGFDGPLAPAQVLCDMTTAGGGWTNLAAKIGDFTNVFSVEVAYEGYSQLGTLSDAGINMNSLASSPISGTLQSLQSDLVGNCKSYNKNIRLTPQVLNYLNPSQVKYRAKSYGTGNFSCGGLLRHASGINFTTLVQQNSFDSRTLASCIGAYTYPQVSNSADLSFYANIVSGANFNSPLNVAAIEAQCGTGYAYIQLHQLWIR